MLCTCINEWIYSTDNFSNQALVDFKIQSSHTEKLSKNDRQKWTTMYRVIFVTLLTNKSQAHGEPITVLYAKNIVLYGQYNINTHDSCIFDQLIANVCPVVHTGQMCQMCCKLKLKTLNNRKTTASLRNHRKRRVCSDPCICTAQRYSFFFSEVLHEIWRIFPRSFDIVVISDIPTRYLIFCTKQTRKQSLFYRQHPERHMTFTECIHFPSRMACLCSETSKRVL